MTLKSQKRIASQLLKVGVNRVWFDPERLIEIKEAITKADIRSLIKDLAIQIRPFTGNSRFRIRKILVQKRKGRKQGKGSRKGKRTSRLSSKQEWMNRLRAQRYLIKELKESDMINNNTYKDVYRKSKGGFFRSKRHIMLYLNENKLISKNGKK